MGWLCVSECEVGLETKTDVSGEIEAPKFGGGSTN